MPKKIVLITGASSGIGQACVRKFLDIGFVVYAAARRVEKMSYMEELGVRLINLDLTNDNSMINCINEIYKKEDRIDVLVNNAGYGSYGALEDVNIQEAKHQYEVNVFGLARMIQLVLPIMRKNKTGKIINISSIGGKIHIPLGSWYHSSKYAVEGLSDCLRTELKEFDIDVILIQPGIIKTEWLDICINKLKSTTGNGPYRIASEKQIKSMQEVYDNNFSKPEVVADTIIKSVTARKPKTRYAVGKMAYLLTVRKFVSDRLFDKLIRYNLNKYLEK